ncbi:MAG: adenine phosphoribosyltransferase [Planctomycetota bacterium]|jgi:adenine phosphoribosyltransferase|nr:adenine phosphoribosyltransferase [Planctomycetota bacterium]
MDIDHIASLIRDIPDFPKAGINFKDITPLLQDPGGLRTVTSAMADNFKDNGVNGVIGIESRGFIFGAPLAYEMGVAYIPVRKPGKLPHKTRSVTYALEYGEDTLEVHEDAIYEGDRVVIVDDVLATGGTAAATCSLVRGLGADVVSCSFLMELSFLDGRQKLPDTEIFSLITF